MARLQDVADVRLRAMTGGWLVSADEVLVGQIDEGELFVKVSPFLDRSAPELDRRPPYPGARPAAVVPPDRLDDAEWLHELLRGSTEALRRPARRPGSTRD